ncbi:hypothetical protein OH77DRAFT_475884 [Trametes cingulata]|nr:hypothetical protein OH77DRAFT_475884 [Trametes cingulata]
MLHPCALFALSISVCLARGRGDIETGTFANASMRTTGDRLRLCWSSTHAGPSSAYVICSMNVFLLTNCFITPSCSCRAERAVTEQWGGWRLNIQSWFPETRLTSGQGVLESV